MSRHFSCPRGHQWEGPADGALPDDTLICPICHPAYADPPLPPEPLPAVQALSALFASAPSDSNLGPPTDPAPGAANGLADPAKGAAALGPATIAGYELLEVLGRGGMGIVYKARELRLQRLVALKVTAPGVQAAPEELARFRSEAEAVARLEHPHIVRVYGAGEQDGRPFFAMEYVNGGSLARRLNGTPLPPLVAAELLETLAGAVHYAHECGLIHRDLKPSNILLAADARRETQIRTEREGSTSALPGPPPGPGIGVDLRASAAKIADFGLAKRLDATDDRTRSGAILGTPHYMAPEQALGATRAIGPAADVYALGAILYECLTGRPPFQAAAVLDVLEQVRHQEPVPPRRLQPGLPADLQTICLKCLEKDPTRRYAAASELADDLRRFRNTEPIRARPARIREKVGKWTRRQPALAALVVVLGLAVVAGVLGIVLHDARMRVEANRAAAGEAHALQERERADASYHSARDSLSRLLHRLESKKNSDVPRLAEIKLEILEEALSFYEGVLREQEHPDVELRSNTAFAYHAAATQEGFLGHTDRAIANYRRCLEFYRQLAEEHPESAHFQEALASTLRNLGQLRGDDACRRQAIAVLEELTRSRPDVPAFQEYLAQAVHHLGASYQVTGHGAEAEVQYERALALREPLLDRSFPQRDDMLRGLAETCVNLGLRCGATNRTERAQTLYRRAETLLQPFVQTDSKDIGAAMTWSALQTNWGNLVANPKNPSEAFSRYDEAIRSAEAVLRLEPRYAAARNAAHTGHGARGFFLHRLGRHAEAIPEWDRALELSDTPAQRHEIRFNRTVSLTLLGCHDRAAFEAWVLAADPLSSAYHLFVLAHVCAVCMNAAEADPKLPSWERTRAMQEYGDDAIRLLRRLYTEGKLDARRLHTLKHDEGFVALRARLDCQRLIWAAEDRK
jgi:serine/threonine protein kinase/tetratricopeptide (TPR) repeat protein